MCETDKVNYNFIKPVWAVNLYQSENHCNENNLAI
jgi:hypothetical protein